MNKPIKTFEIQIQITNKTEFNKMKPILSKRIIFLPGEGTIFTLKKLVDKIG